MSFTNNSTHYNTISEAWPFMLGNNFHWGYFKDKEDSLELSTYQLIDLMIDFGNVAKNSKVLDIGCGIGEPASYLVEKLDCTVTGISNSETGIEMARTRNSTIENLDFQVKDALNLEIENTYNVAWLLEMSHLIEDKRKLVEESCKALKSGGQIVLCDLTLLQPLSAKEIVRMLKDLKTMEQSFGKAQLWTLEKYKECFESLDLENIKVLDISKEVTPTIQAWKANCLANKSKIIESIGESHLDNFVESCDILEVLYTSGKWGYGVITASKK